MIEIVEVGPRDGLQNADSILTVRQRAQLVERIAAAGLKRIEAVSFVSPKRVPQMADAEAVIEAAEPGEETELIGLVLNARGYERLRASGLGSVRFTFAVSDAFNQRNSGMSAANGLRIATEVMRDAKASGLGAGVVLATSFGCPFSGPVDEGVVLRYAETLASEGADEIVFADTIGCGVPSQVRRLLSGFEGGDARVGVHLHNTRNTGFVNAWQAIESGATILDASIGGLGGCPFAPAATGNIATEDLAYLLQREGIETGIDLPSLIDTANWLEKATQLELSGMVRLAPWY